MPESPHIAFVGKPVRLVAEHDDLCATRRGHPCNCPMSIFMRDVSSKERSNEDS
jgi:hypothetical protein